MLLTVASFAEAWIEIHRTPAKCFRLHVASFAEAWIEIREFAIASKPCSSPPSRRRGLKSFISSGCPYLPIVASFAEAWIEIGTTYKLSPLMQVASFAEAWIEIGKKT